MKRRGAVLVEPGRFETEEDEISPGPGELLVAVEAAGLCPWDLLSYQGQWREEVPKWLGGEISGLSARLYTYEQWGEYPKRLGHEPVGRVVEVGRGVRGFAPGERVTGFFGEAFADVAIAPADQVLKVSPGIPPQHALGEPLSNIIIAVRAASVEIGDYVLLIGCGCLGLNILSGLAGTPAAEIIAVDLKADALRLAKECGATITLNAGQVDVIEEVLRITEGRGVDVAIEACGVPAVLDTCAACLRREGQGRLILAGGHTSPATYDLAPLCIYGAVIHAAWPRHSHDRMDDLRRALLMLARGRFPMERLITHRFRLEEIGQAFETMLHRPGGYIKGVVVP